MTREQLEHLIRAAAELAGDTEIVVVGSQAILGAHPDAPAELRTSMEADLFPKNHVDRADVIDGSIGEGSPFHDTFGYYAQGVGPETSVLPAGWEGRLVLIRNENTRGATGWALEPHDLAISKYVAGRQKDRDFLRVAIEHRLLDRGRLSDGLENTSALSDDQKSRITAQIDRDFALIA